MMTLSQVVGRVNYGLGAQGETVRQIQVALARLGYPLRGTGYFGNATDTAVTAFQKRIGVLADGVVGLETAAKLDAALSGLVPVLRETPKEEIKRPLWIEAGLRLLQTKERPGPLDNPEILEWAKEEGGEIAKEYVHDSIPWCALFVGHCLTSVSLKGTGTLWALDYAGQWPCVRLAGPAVGAVAPMKRPGGGHVIFVIGRDQHGNVMGLGGNQSDEVSVRPFPLARLNQGFWWPKEVPVPMTGFSGLPIVQSDGRVSVKEA